MKALTLTQPWATLVALGAKRYETRSWRTAYRGPLAIHAAKGFPWQATTYAYTDPQVRGVVPDHELPYPRGVVLCIVTLMDCRRIEDLTALSIQERAFGDYGPGRWAWQLTDLQLLNSPYPCKGSLGLWNVTIPSGYMVREEP